MKNNHKSCSYVSQFSAERPVLFIDSADYQKENYSFYRDSLINILDFKIITKVIGSLADTTGLGMDTLLAKYCIPVQNTAEIRARQEIVREIYENPALEERIEKIVWSAGKIHRWNERFIDRRSLEDKTTEAGLLVDFIESALAIAPKSGRLKSVRQFAESIAQIPQYRVLKSYSAMVSSRFKEYFGSQDESDEAPDSKEDATGAGLVAKYMKTAGYAKGAGRWIDRLDVDARRQMYSALCDLQQIFTELLHNPALESIIDREEAKALDLEGQMDYAMAQLKNTSLLNFKYRAKTARAQKYFHSGFNALLDHVNQLISDGLNSAMEKLNISVKSLAGELAFYYGLARLAHEMELKSPITMPILLAPEKRYCSIKGGNIPSFTLRNGLLVANDVFSDAGNYVFLITGANDNGKTTYERMVAQMQILAQLGSFIPSKKAKMSIVDNIITSFGGIDKPEKKEGTFRSALNFLSFITSPKAVNRKEEDGDLEDRFFGREVFEPILEKPSIGEIAYAYGDGRLFFTPHSLLVFDEIAIGSDSESTEEAISRTLIAAQQRKARLLLSTHYHPLAERVQNGKFLGVMNLGAVMRMKKGKLFETYKIIRGRHEPSYGQRLFKEAGFTQEDVDNAARLLAEAGVIDSKHSKSIRK